MTYDEALDSALRFLDDIAKHEIEPTFDCEVLEAKDAAEAIRHHRRGENKAESFDSHLQDSAKLELRMQALAYGAKAAEMKGKPGHAVYIAADMYRFVVTGEKPVIPGRDPAPSSNVSPLKARKA